MLKQVNINMLMDSEDIKWFADYLKNSINFQNPDKEQTAFVNNLANTLETVFTTEKTIHFGKLSGNIEN